MFRAFSSNLSASALAPPVTVLLLVGLLIQAAPTAAPQPPPPAGGAALLTVAAPLTAMESTPVTLRLRNTDKPTLALAVRNDSAKERRVDWRLKLRDNAGQDVEMSGPAGEPTIVPPHEVRTVNVGVAAVGRSSLPTPLTGWVIIQTLEAAPSKTVIGVKSIDVRVVAAPAESRIVFGSAAAAVVAVVISAVAIVVGWRRKPPEETLGAPEWQPSESWATNAAVGATLLTNLLQWVALPEHMARFSKATYLLLGILFAALVALAPVIFALLKTGAAAPIRKRTWLIVPVLLLATFFTCTGAFGQLSTLVLVFGDLADANLIGQGTRLFFATVVTVLILAIFGYAVSATYFTVFPTAPPKVSTVDMLGDGRFVRMLTTPKRGAESTEGSRPWPIL